MPFTKNTLDYLLENRLRDSRIWFIENKSQFNKCVVTPLAELVTSLTDTMLNIDDKFIFEPKIGKCISRIYRDTRFSRDKSLYRDVMWIVFTRNKNLYQGMPGFFFEISPNGFRYGCGYYRADRSTMENIRSLILENDKDFEKAINTYEKQDVFEIEGEKYKKSKYSNQPERLKNWLDRKNIVFVHNSTDFSKLFSISLANEIADGFKSISSIYKFLIKSG